MDQAAPTSALGIARDTLLPSLKLHSSLSLVAFTAARLTDRGEVKDWLWPSGMVANAWWSALESHPGDGLLGAFKQLEWPEKTLLVGVTAWGVRLFYHIASRSITRGKDDARYEAAKKQKGYWTKTLFGQFLSEAIFQSLISLSFTAPFRLQKFDSPPPNLADVVRGLAVGLFSAGSALEVLADWQKDQHKREGKTGLKKDGVWSIVRHPNYLGDALIHFSFPLLLYSRGKFHPLFLLSSITNYLFLRNVGGDKENEENQMVRYKLEDPEKYLQLEEWQQKENSFWPGANSLFNPWTWAIVMTGVGGVVLERGLASYCQSV